MTWHDLHPDVSLTRDASPLVRQDVLLLAGAEDHYVPLEQLHDQMRWLVSAR
jgi:hypothetical protein